MGYAQKPTGMRRFTAADKRVKEYIASYDAMNKKPTRKEVLTTFKRAARPLGLDYRVIGAMDQLASLAQEQDWKGGPITVWPSNEKLMRMWGLAKRSVQDLLRLLKERELIAFIDSPTGARYGRRDAEGRIVEAYGIDLRPLAARAEEFAELAAQEDAEEQARKGLRRERTIVRKAIQQVALAAIESGGVEDYWNDVAWQAMQIAEDSIDIRSVSHLQSVVDELQTRLAAAEEAYSDLLNGLHSVDKTPEDAVDRTPITTITKPQFLRKKQSDAYEESSSGEASTQNSKARCGRIDPGPSQDGPDAIERRRRANIDMIQKAKARIMPNLPRQRMAEHFETYKITPRRIAAGCSTMRDHLFTEDPGWVEIVESSYSMLHWLDISQHAWAKACETLSREGAALAVAIIAEKHALGQRGIGNGVSSPGGYLRWMTKMAATEGKIDLGPKLYGLRAEQNA